MAVGSERRVYVAIALLSASLLAFEVLLTRVCALRLHFHFGFLVISNGLLGMGASGSLLAITERRWRRAPGTWIHRASAGYVVALAVSWLLLLSLPVPDRLTFAELRGARELLVFNLAAALPFFFGGAAVGLILSHHARNVDRVYGWDLLGAGLGCLIVPASLGQVGAGGAFAALLLLAILGWAATAPPPARKMAAGVAGALGLLLLAAMPSLDGRFPVPGKGYLDLTDEVRAVYGDRLGYRRWSTNSRIDVLELEPAERFMFCRGPKLLALPLPEQRLILQDGSAGTIVSNHSGDPRGPRILRDSLYSLGISIASPSPEVLVIGMGGGDDVWATKLGGAKSVRAVELNAGVVAVHRELVPHYSRGLLEDPSIEIVVDEGRSAVMRDPRRYDLIQMTGIDTWTALSSGAYVLAENYLYTVEAFGDLYDHLRPGGILQITRMAATMETLRLISNLDAALSARGATLTGSMAALGNRRILTTALVKKGAFTEAEVTALLGFAERGGYEPIIVPGREPVTLPEKYLARADKAAFVAEFPRDISATTDDRPYFFSFTRWSAPAASTLYIDEAMSVSQGNPAFLLGQLGLSTVLAACFILAPLALRRRADEDAVDEGNAAHRVRLLVYFACLGMGFIAIEVALLQKLTLVLGQPLHSLVVTLLSLLIFSGLGSMASKRWLRRPRDRWWLPVGIAFYAIALATMGRRLVEPLVGFGFAMRAAGAVALVAPLGLLLGAPFAVGIRSVEAAAPRLVPWAWAVNASTTVVGSILTVVVSMNFGFSVVMVGAAGLYLLGFALLPTARLTG
ncbi:MAG: hypothetical protein R3B72_31710 [Polyangiaceae bacterium]